MTIKNENLKFIKIFVYEGSFIHRYILNNVSKGCTGTVIKDKSLEIHKNCFIMKDIFRKKNSENQISGGTRERRSKLKT